MTTSVAMIRPGERTPRAVYVHVPFCKHRCGYCNFAVVAGRDHLIERYLNALEFEIEQQDHVYEIDTLFVGGGTPSHLNVCDLRRLLSAHTSRFRLSEGAEFSVECNPTDLNAERAEVMAIAGVTRISLGVQSFETDKLVFLERSHRAGDVRQSVEAAQRFAASVSLDLIFGTPSESLSDWLGDVERAIELGPNHISTYELTYEKGTRFWSQLQRKQMTELPEGLRAEMYCRAIDRLESAGFSQYEVSSFERGGHRCRHNEVYWTGGDYFGFGPGAASYLHGIRRINHQSTTEYLKRVESGRSPVFQREKLDPPTAAAERLILGLRRLDGIQAPEFERQTGKSVEQVLGRMSDALLRNELISVDGDVWKLTRDGLLLSDQIAIELLSHID